MTQTLVSFFARLPAVLRQVAVLAAIRTLHVAPVARRHVACRLLPCACCRTSRCATLPPAAWAAYEPARSSSSGRLIPLGPHEGEDFELVRDGLFLEARDDEFIVGILECIPASFVLHLRLKVVLVLDVADGILDQSEGRFGALRVQVLVDLDVPDGEALEALELLVRWIFIMQGHMGCDDRREQLNKC